MKQIAGGRRLILVAMLIAALTAVVVRPSGTSAHPLGNFTVNQYSRIEATETGLRLVYVLDLAEIPAFQEIEAADADGNGTIDDAERARYLDEKLEEITPNLHLAVDEQELTLQVVERDVTFPEGQAGLKLVRLRAVLAPAAPILSAAPRAVTYQNDYAADRLGWREIVVSHGAGIRLDGSDAPATDASDELRAYPEDLLSSPLDRSRARFSLALAPGAAAADGFEHFASAGQTAIDANQARPGSGTAGARFASLIDEGNLTAAGIVVALLAAMLWGAMHALSPGHGKTVVGAYLVGSRGTARHAAFLGLTVTVTHTAGVLMVGLVTLFASHFIVPERLYPWMSVVSGALVVVMGTTIFWRRLRGLPTFGHHHHHDHHHDHGHDHEHADHHHHDHGGHGHSHLPPGTDSAPVTWRALLALGVSGGLIPCPSALVVLLGSIALGRAGFGLALVVAFSLGLAATLTGVGLLFLYAGRLIERRIASKPWMGLLMRFAPAGGALALTLAGLAIIVRALGETGLR